MTAPTIHRNGTSGTALLRTHQYAIDSVNTALNALTGCAPHGRDYYPQGDDAYERARRQHDARVKVLCLIRDELLEIQDGIQKQLGRAKA